jgi:hypothetical protein
MPAAVNAFYEYALAVSKKSGIFFSDVRRDAWEFAVSKNTITAWTHRLEKSGWFKRVDHGKRLKRNPFTGSFESIRYEIISHKVWAENHPGRCRFFTPETLSQLLGQAKSPVPISSDHRSQLTGTTGPN